MLDLSSSSQAASESRSGGTTKIDARANIEFVDAALTGQGVASGALSTAVPFGSNVLGPSLHGQSAQGQGADFSATGEGREVSSFGTSVTPQFLQTARHPIICIFHILFKGLALLSFLFGSFLFGGWEGDFVFTFVITTILVSIDFWIVKNITGRLLVGMRWWNEVREDGANDWIFEAHTDERSINRSDRMVFWTGIYCWPLFWFALLLVYLLRFDVEWVLLVSVGLTLSMANLVGYWKCSAETKRQVQSWASSKAFSMLLGRFF